MFVEHSRPTAGRSVRRRVQASTPLAMHEMCAVKPRQFTRRNSPAGSIQAPGDPKNDASVTRVLTQLQRRTRRRTADWASLIANRGSTGTTRHAPRAAEKRRDNCYTQRDHPLRSDRLCPLGQTQSAATVTIGTRDVMTAHRARILDTPQRAGTLHDMESHFRANKR